mmetsp:Transcript_12370/g.35120  ORF Transcript_12370/g.35120 Transcript_12370/m.35120 type:complete len:339 (-) Transcript_12370:1370-2386(-)
MRTLVEAQRISRVRVRVSQLLVLLQGDLLLHGLPVHLQLLRPLLELLVGLHVLHLLEVLLPVGQHGVHVRLVLRGQLQRVVPSVQPDVHLDGPVNPLALKQDVQGLLRLLAEERELRRAENLVRQLVDVRDELHLVHLLDGRERDLHGVQRAGVHGHGRQRGPELRGLHVAAEAHRLLPLALLVVLVEQLRVGRGDHAQVGAVRLADEAVGAVEGHDLRVLPRVRACLGLQRLAQQVLVHEHHGGVDEHDELLVDEGDEHVRGVVPAEGVHHGPELLHLVALHGLGQVEVLVLVQDGDLAVGARALLVQGDADDVQLVLDRLAHGAPREDVEDTDLLG